MSPGIMRFCLPVLFLLITAVVAATPAMAALPDVAWNHTYRLESDSDGYSVVAVSDGYVATGSVGTGGDRKLLLLKTDGGGRLLWQKAFGTQAQNLGTDLRQTRDGGFIIVGQTSVAPYDHSDVYLVKTDSNGNEQWEHTYGGARSELGVSVWQTSDNGYIITGTTYLPGRNDSDVYLLKVDQTGREQWSKTLGGTTNNQGKSVQQTSDSGFIIAGTSGSYGENEDCYLIKTDGKGTEQWNRTYGGAGYEAAYTVRQTSDGGYVLAGVTSSYSSSTYDMYVVKTDPDGNEQWNQTYGGDQGDYGMSIQPTADGGYLIAGSTFSFGNQSGAIYLVRTDEKGNLKWQAAYGDGITIGSDSFFQQTGDGGCIFTGSTTTYEPVYGRLLKHETSYYRDLVLLKLDNVTSTPVSSATSTITALPGVVTSPSPAASPTQSPGFNPVLTLSALVAGLLALTHRASSGRGGDKP